MSVFRVALLQMTSCGVDQRANLEKGEAFCREAARLGTDVALFPEMWNIGYANVCPPERNPGDLWRAPGRFDRDPDPRFDAELAEWRAAWQARAIGPDDTFVTHFRCLARSLGMAVALTYLERWPGAPRNSVSLIDRRGEIVLTYAKVHTCAFDVDEAGLTPGGGFPVVALETASGPVNVGAMICFDREFPESARLLMLNGAEVILTPNACEMDLHRVAQFRTRAFENMTAVALANYAAPEANGHSVAYDPIAFEDGRSRDTLVIEAGEGEGVFLAEFDMARIRDYREREAMGNAFRRPALYGPLAEPGAKPPFLRVDRAGVPFGRCRARQIRPGRNRPRHRPQRWRRPSPGCFALPGRDS